MITEELKTDRIPLTSDTRMITNLQNLKHVLKKTHDDKEILNFLSGFSFTDKLIEKHLSSSSDYKSSKGIKYVPRDPKHFRDYMKKLPSTRDRYDPFTNYYLEKSQQKEYVNKVLPDKVKNARNDAEKQMYQELLDNALLQQEFSEQSNLNIGTHVFKTYDIKYDISTLLRDENDYDIDETVFDDSINDQLYLNQQRCRAEANLIKTTILNKLHHDISLTKAECDYLKVWKENIGSNFCPKDPSNLKLSDLDSDDISKLNSLHLINFSKLDEYSLNDIVLELNHFIDPVVISDIEHEIHVETLKSQWGLPSDFIVSEKRHKEIDLVLGQVEENAYRHSGKFESNELEGFTEM